MKLQPVTSRPVSFYDDNGAFITSYDPARAQGREEQGSYLRARTVLEAARKEQRISRETYINDIEQLKACRCQLIKCRDIDLIDTALADLFYDELIPEDPKVFESFRIRAKLNTLDDIIKRFNEQKRKLQIVKRNLPKAA